MEGLYLYMYYPVNYVEMERSRDVFLGTRDEAASIIRRTEISREWVPYMRSGAVAEGSGSYRRSAGKHC